VLFISMYIKVYLNQVKARYLSQTFEWNLKP